MMIIMMMFSKNKVNAALAGVVLFSAVLSKIEVMLFNNIANRKSTDALSANKILNGFNKSSLAFSAFKIYEPAIMNIKPVTGISLIDSDRKSNPSK